MEKREEDSSEGLHDLALSVEASLPPELADLLAISPDAGKKLLVITFKRRLKQEEFALVASAIRGLGGEFFNVAKNEHFEVPLPKPVALQVEKPKEEHKAPPAAQPKKPEAKQPQKPKMPSPPSLFVAQNCASCESLETCRSNPSAQSACVEVLRLGALRDCASEFCGLNENLHAVVELLKARPQPQLQTQTQPAAPAPTSTPVQRSTRPTTGYRDDQSGIIWTKQSGENGDYEKATEADNKNAPKFYEALGWLHEHQDKPFLDGFYYWEFDQGPLTIGRKRCRPRGRGY
jgi:hypothetical protein